MYSPHPKRKDVSYGVNAAGSWNLSAAEERIWKLCKSGASYKAKNKVFICLFWKFFSPFWFDPMMFRVCSSLWAQDTLLLGALGTLWDHGDWISALPAILPFWSLKMLSCVKTKQKPVETETVLFLMKLQTLLQPKYPPGSLKNLIRDWFLLQTCNPCIAQVQPDSWQDWTLCAGMV